MTLWRRPDFLKIWTGQTISEMGSRISREGLPITAVLILHATPAQMGWLAALSGIAAVLVSPYAGALADRSRRRPILIGADLGRAAVLATIPIAYLAGILSIWQLFVCAAAAGILTVFFDVSYPTYVPTLVPQDQLLEANSKLALTVSIAEVTGPAFTGILIKLVTAPFAIALDALSFVVSAFSIAIIRTPEPKPAAGSAREDLSSGFRFIFSHPLLRSIALRTATASFSAGVFFTLYVYYAISILKMTTVELGIVISLGGIGNLVGALIANHLGHRLPTRATLIAATLWQGASALLVSLPSGPGMAAVLLWGASQLFGDIANPLYAIYELTFRQSATPKELHGRVNAAMQLLYKGAMPAGSLVGGLLATWSSPRMALFAGALGIMLSALWLVFSKPSGKGDFIGTLKPDSWNPK